MYMETVDEFEPALDFPRHMEMSPRCVEWGDLMRGYQVPAPEARAGDWWADMDEVFDLETQHRHMVQNERDQHRHMVQSKGDGGGGSDDGEDGGDIDDAASGRS